MSNRVGMTVGLAIGAITLTTSTAVLSSIAAVKGYKEVLKKEEETEQKLSKKEIAKLCWKNYIPVAGCFLGSIGCTVGSTGLAMKQIAGLSAALAATSTGYAKYKGEIKKLLPKDIQDKVDKAFTEEMTKDISTNKIPKKPDTPPFEEQPALFHYQWYNENNGFFWAKETDVLRAFRNADEIMIKDEILPLNAFLGCLGLKLNDISGYTMGWSQESNLADWGEYGWNGYEYFEVTNKENGQKYFEIGSDIPPYSTYNTCRTGKGYEEYFTMSDLKAVVHRAEQFGIQSGNKQEELHESYEHIY